MKLHSIELKNYRLFPELRCELHPSLTVFVANNGGGKTSVLDAIRVLFDTYLGAFPTGKGHGIKPGDVRRVPINGATVITMPAFPSEIHGTGELTPDGPAIAWSRALNSTKSGTTVKDARRLAEYAKALQKASAEPGLQEDWPLLAYYGTGRLWSQKKITVLKQYAAIYHTRSAAYMDCMESASGFKYFAEWYEYAFRTVIAAQHIYLTKHINATREGILAQENGYSPLISAVQQAVDTVLSPAGWRNLAYSFELGEITADHREFGTLPVNQLSDGIRSTIGLVADIAYRAVQLNPHLGKAAAQQARGIVLIDEVDMHLHPSWQQVILLNLQQAFPNLQFIVTTHSPQVLTSVDAACIRKLQQTMQVHESVVVETVEQQTKGVASSDVLAEIMEVNPVPDIPEARMLADYQNLIQQNLYDTDDGRGLRARLEAHFGPSHPVIRECDSLIRLQLFKQKLPARHATSG